MKGRECKLEHKAKEKKSQRSEIITYLSLMLVSLFLDVRDLLTFFSARMQGLKTMSECEKLSNRTPEWNAIYPFAEWLQEQGIILSRYFKDKEGNRYEHLQPISESLEYLLYKLKP